MFSCGRVAHPKVSEAVRYLPCLLYGQVGNRVFIILLFGWFKVLCVVLAILIRASHILGLSYTPKTCTPF